MNHQNHIREFREKAGLSQVSVAAAAEVQPSFLCKTELHHFSVTPPVAKRIAGALNTPVSKIFPYLEGKERP